MTGVPGEPLVIATTRRRAADRLDFDATGLSEPTIAEIVEGARAAGRQRVVLGGGEPTLRDDLDRLVAAVAPLAPGFVLATDGLALVARPVVDGLRAAGLATVRIGFHCARLDAHDWLVGLPGAAKRAIAAIRACAEAGLGTEAVVVVTRPTAPYLAETAELLARLGVRRVVLRPVERRGPAADEWVALSPPLALVEAPLASATSLLAARGVEAIVGFDVSQPDPAPLLAPCGPTVVAATGRGLGVIPPPNVRGLDGGVPEIVSVGWSAPSRVACPTCGVPAAGAVEPTRAIRLRLVQAAQVGADRLLLEGPGLLVHPHAPDLLREALRLSFPEVVVFAEASALDEWTDAELRRLRGTSRMIAPRYGRDGAGHDDHIGRPGAWAATLRGLERLRRLASVPCAIRDVRHELRRSQG